MSPIIKTFGKAFLKFSLLLSGRLDILVALSGVILVVGIELGVLARCKKIFVFGASVGFGLVGRLEEIHDEH